MPKTQLVIDIETVGLSDEELNPKVLGYHRERWKRRKKEEAKEVEVDEEREKALNWALGRIICISYGYPEPNSSELQVESLLDPEERRLLLEFWARMERFGPSGRADLQFVGFNSLFFDFPFITGRSAILRIKPTLELPLRLYDLEHHYDVRMVLTNWNRQGLGTLEYWGEVFGLQYDPTVCKSHEVAERYRAQDFEAVRRHCEADVRLTWQLYRRLNFLD